MKGFPFGDFPGPRSYANLNRGGRGFVWNKTFHGFINYDELVKTPKPLPRAFRLSFWGEAEESRISIAQGKLREGSLSASVWAYKFFRSPSSVSP